MVYGGNLRDLIRIVSITIHVQIFACLLQDIFCVVGYKKIMLE